MTSTPTSPSTSTPTSTTIEVATWSDLHAVPEVMDELGAQAEAVVRHAREWVCNPAGFAPTPACLLRPLADVMETLDAAFAEVGRLFADDWAQLRDGVVVASSDLLATDHAVAARLPEVA